MHRCRPETTCLPIVECLVPAVFAADRGEQWATRRHFRSAIDDKTISCARIGLCMVSDPSASAEL